MPPARGPRGRMSTSPRRASTSSRAGPAAGGVPANILGGPAGNTSLASSQHSPGPRNGTARGLGNTSVSLSHDQWDNLRRQSNLSTLSLSPRRPSSSTPSSSASGTARAGSSAHTATGRAPHRVRRASKLGHGNSTVDNSFDDSSRMQDVGEQDGEQDNNEDEEYQEWTMVDRMRNWRNDAMTQHLYSTANFWGNKIYGLTQDPNDAFWLAQTHFFTHNFAQALSVLVAPPSRLSDVSLACRYLAAQCLVRLGQWEEALELVGKGGLGVLELNGSSSYADGTAGDEDSRGDGGIKLTASTAHLRGLIHLHLGATDLAKEAFMEALSRDVKCFESFEMLVGSEMMKSEEEWNFIQGLQYAAQTGDDGDFVKMMYTVRLKKVKRRDEMAVARQRLSDDYGLADDPDVLFGLADELYTSLRFAECFRVTSKILATHASHRPTLPLHLSCMHHLPNLRSRLYLLAQQLVENEPDDAISWYAVGMWYFSGKRWDESRRYFGKSVLIDSRFGPSWIAFAHSYAFEGEHDQAITAYSTALRHFQGTHLPLMFIGMQHLGLSNISLAKEYLEAAREACSEDPLVLNELGVVAQMDGRYQDAVDSFQEALRLARQIQGSKSAWSTTHLNLGHAQRKLGRLNESHTCFLKVIELDPRSAGAYAGLGLVEHMLCNYQESIARYHEALSISPGDPVTCDLLKLVLEDAETQMSSTNFAFPGLPPTTQRNIDSLVQKLDQDIALGLPPESDMPAHLAAATASNGVGASDRTVEGEETMDMSG